MRNLTCFVALLMPVLVNAQSFPGADLQQMQGMMEKVKELKACMQKVDQVKVHDFQQRGKQMSEKIQALCVAGKREEAVDEAMSYAKDIAADPTMRDMQKCGKIMEGFMPDISSAAHTYEQDSSKGHICDE